ncbi:glycosyltransferase family 4 protein [Microbacterium sp. ARD31]|uniref:glycosyltransferase family 4 protein n=1 Tax=Microbacterium sp. ARD31 TaxID=2962576 RepID=UPI002882CA3B|nr:glycosyltransferase family 4 protein [Microbacterium sp. ARD31]MDT0186480.1 glycosyltransferase family 4 protein [Microbacterium sp. ARD31]
MSTVRILHAIRSDGFAGVEQLVLRLAIAQADAGSTVHVIGGDPARMARPLADAGVRHTATADRAWAVAQAIHRHAGDADIVNSHMTAADVAASVALAGLRDAPPLVSTRHFARRRGRLAALPVGRVVASRISAEIAISEAVAAAIEGPSTVVHPGVPKRDAVDHAARHRTVLVAQRLEPEKRTRMAMEVFAASGVARDGWRLMIAGEGVERLLLETTAAELGLTDVVTFLGFRTDVPNLMDAAGLLLATAEFEHFGLTVLEAMASGLPVVASDAGGHRETLSNLDPRVLFPVDDIAGAARRLRELVSDSDGRHRLGDAERRRQQSAFSLDAQREATEAVYRRSMTLPGRR